MRFALIVLASACWIDAAVAQQEQEADIRSDELEQPRASAVPLSAQASHWRCEFLVSDVCSRDGCQREILVPGTRWATLEFGEGPPGMRPVTYTRCGQTGCDLFPGIAVLSGDYTAVELPYHASFIKVLNDGTEFVDVATLGTAAFVNYGRCLPD